LGLSDLLSLNRHTVIFGIFGISSLVFCMYGGVSVMEVLRNNRFLCKYSGLQYILP
jgi:hypothetical protein